MNSHALGCQGRRPLPKVSKWPSRMKVQTGAPIGLAMSLTEVPGAMARSRARDRAAASALEALVRRRRLGCAGTRGFPDPDPKRLF